MTSQSSDFNVCILGGINIDFFSVVKDMPVAGETIVGSDFFVLQLFFIPGVLYLKIS